MSTETGPVPASAPETDVTVRYWAAARTAAGVDAEQVAVDGPVSLAWVLDQVRARHDSARFREVVAACSVLVGDRPVGGYDPADVEVRPGASVELLPPFAGG